MDISKDLIEICNKNAMEAGVQINFQQGIKHDYNRKKYGFITDWVFYSEDGKAKTDKLTYEGYRLVEDKR